MPTASDAKSSPRTRELRHGRAGDRRLLRSAWCRAHSSGAHSAARTMGWGGERARDQPRPVAAPVRRIPRRHRAQSRLPSNDSPSFGVMPPGVDYPSGVEAWRTTHSVPTGGLLGDAARREVDLAARLRPGVTLAQATSEIAALTRRLESSAPSARRAVSSPSFVLSRRWLSATCALPCSRFSMAAVGLSVHRERECREPPADARRGATSGACGA